MIEESGNISRTLPKEIGMVSSNLSQNNHGDFDFHRVFSMIESQELINGTTI